MKPIERRITRLEEGKGTSRAMMHFIRGPRDTDPASLGIEVGLNDDVLYDAPEHGGEPEHVFSRPIKELLKDIAENGKGFGHWLPPVGEVA